MRKPLSLLTLGLVLLLTLLVTPVLGPLSQVSAAVGARASFLGHSQSGGESGEPDWALRTPVTSPTARSEHAMAYDAARGVTVLFGGWDSSGYLNETWEWDGVDWVQRTPATAPSTRMGPAMAYDAERGVTVLFGGYNDGGAMSDTWEWDGDDWLQRTPATIPPVRGLAAMAYDSARGVTVLFGGWYYDYMHRYLDDTWEWDGEDWVQRTPAAAPSGRSMTGLAYDAGRGVTVLFGGFNGGFLGDTWEWDGTDWLQRTPAAAPSARYSGRMVYDAARGVSLLFGGYDVTYNDQNDTWDWDGTDWVQRSPANSPPARELHAMAYDSARGLAVLFGGTGPIGWLGDTWEYPMATGWTVYVPVVLRAYPPGP